MSPDDHQEEWEDVNSRGDPTDGTDNLAIDGCVNNWKAAQSDSKKRS